MALDFPASPTVGQTYTAGNTTWTWNGSSWTSSGGAAIAVLTVGKVTALTRGVVLP